MTKPTAVVDQRERPREGRGSPIARAALLAYLLLIVYASWYPFTGWRDSGLPLFTFLNLVKQRYWTGFDVGVNVFGYVPLGVLLVLSIYPRIRGIWAVLVAAIGGVLVTIAMETVQNFLPSRVPSNLDLMTNAGGCLVGAILGAWWAPGLLDRSRLFQLRRRWFAPYASQGLVLVALWPLAQIYPQSYLFGHGQVLPIISGWLSRLFDTEIDLVAMLRPDAVMTVEQYWLSETIITACGMTGAVLTLMCLVRRSAPRFLLMVGFLAIALLVKTLASSLLFRPDNAFVWVTPGAEGGFIIGMLMLAGLVFAPQVAQRRLAVVTLVLSLIVVNTVPVNPYFVSTLQGWVQGKFLNFNGAAQFLSLMWPFFALWFLLLPSHQLNRQEPRPGAPDQA
ncbi:VanZ family protein [Massilia sp. IC2-477]|uniref:VanZ family protein n=1 Tax=unclassified Massilia TaxID=2609279 RepID=UPI001D126F71|nr:MULTISPECIES: VanZ family protein [unclassified Massilia]MCC2954659.1 VanZ family protein [Massilia sp. IC2-477]MCC2972644.1 VanZ family protein [Massilia sp. IC2-476]